MGESARIYPNIPVWRHGGPAHMALYLAASTTAHTYNIHLSTFPAPGSPQHRQHRQPGAGSPVSQSTNIVIYLSSSRQSPASGAAALGHSHTFTSPTLAQLCPWPSQQLSDCKQYICTKNISYTDSVQNIKFLCYTINTNLWHSPKDLIICYTCYTTPSSGIKVSFSFLLCLVSVML